MRIKRTTTFPNQPTIVEPNYPTDYLEVGDQVRHGFEKGTLTKATFELETGATIIYEKLEIKGNKIDYKKLDEECV
jgi:hypothetical protein